MGIRVDRKEQYRTSVNLFYKLCERLDIYYLIGWKDNKEEEDSELEEAETEEEEVLHDQEVEEEAKGVQEVDKTTRTGFH